MRFPRLILVLALTACTPLAQGRELSPAQWERNAHVLEADNSADALVAAALIYRARLNNPPAALADLDRAQLLAPTDPHIIWLGLTVCSDVTDCDTAPRSVLLQRLDPANAAGYYYVLAQARALGDVAAEDRALAAMAAAQRFDMYWSQLMVRTVDALVLPRGKARPMRDIMLAGADTVGWLAGTAIPPFKPISDTCKGDRLQRTEVLEWCRQLAHVLDNGDTWIASMVGRSVAQRAWKGDEAQTAWFKERRRQYLYASEALASDDPHGDPEDARRWLERYRANPREQDVLRQWLIDLGIPPDAPADWHYEPRKMVAPES